MQLNQEQQIFFTKLGFFKPSLTEVNVINQLVISAYAWKWSMALPCMQAQQFRKLHI